MMWRWASEVLAAAPRVLAHLEKQDVRARGAPFDGLDTTRAQGDGDLAARRRPLQLHRVVSARRHRGAAFAALGR